MEHDLRFGLVLGWLVLKKKIWVDHEQLLGAVFSIVSCSTTQRLTMELIYYELASHQVPFE